MELLFGMFLGFLFGVCFKHYFTKTCKPCDCCPECQCCEVCHCGKLDKKCCDNCKCEKCL